MSNETFLAPRLVGKRFDQHTIPLEILKDLAVLEEMLVEVAKWCFLREHPDRTRTPKGFSEGISLQLAAVNAGSAIAHIALANSQQDLLPAENLRCFQQARDLLIGAVDAAEHEEDVTRFLPSTLLGYFDRIGRGLRDDEAIELAPDQAKRKARLSKASRRRLLVAAQVKDISDDMTLRGTIPEVDYGKWTFQLQTLQGNRLVAPLLAQHLDVVQRANNSFPSDARLKVQVQGIVRCRLNGSPQAIESVEHISLLDPNDIKVRLEELAQLKAGWLDGNLGLPLDANGLGWLETQFLRYYPDELPLPYLYPTAEGQLQAEWTLGQMEASLEIDLQGHRAWWQSTAPTPEDDSRDLDLDQDNDWHWLTDRITTLTGAQR